MKDREHTTHDLPERINRKAQLRHAHLYRAIHKQLMKKWFQYFVLFFIMGSVFSVIYSSFDSSRPYRTALASFNYFASIVFTIEYVLRLLAAPLTYPDKAVWKARLHYIFSFYGLVDFVAILPFVLIYLYWEEPSVVHLIILPYIFIVFKLIRYSRSFRLIGYVLHAVKQELITAYTACGIMLCFSGILMYYIERNAQPQAFSNIGDGFWWAIVAFTTVGYGDIYPITPIGRILSSLISLIGIAMIAIPTGIISSAFMNQMLEKKKKEEEKHTQEPQ